MSKSSTFDHNQNSYLESVKAVRKAPRLRYLGAYLAHLISIFSLGLVERVNRKCFRIIRWKRYAWKVAVQQYKQMCGCPVFIEQFNRKFFKVASNPKDYSVLSLPHSIIKWYFNWSITSSVSHNLTFTPKVGHTV